MDMSGLPSWVNAVVAAAALLTALGVIWRKAIKPIIQWGTGITERLEEIAGMPSRLSTLEKLVARIDRRTLQLEPNGGKSMADQVERIDRSTSRSHTT